MNRTLALSVAFILVVTLIGCTGYPEGPSVSFRNPTELISTTWRVQQAVQNGVDITSEYEGEFFTFEEDGGFRKLEVGYEISLPPFTQDTIFNALGTGDWQFRNDRSQVELLYQIFPFDPYVSGTFYEVTFNELWTIARLAEGELWLRDDSTELRMEFFVP